MKNKKLFPIVLLAFFLASCGRGATTSSEPETLDPSSPESVTSEPATSQEETSQEETTQEVTSEEETSMPHVHSWTFHAAVDPTCTEAGNTEYYTCECGAILNEDEDPVEEIPVVPALGHLHDRKLYQLNEDASITEEVYCTRCAQLEERVDIEGALEDAAGAKFNPMTHINPNGSFSINYTFSGSDKGDWGWELFRAGDYWIAAGCIGYRNPEWAEGVAQDQLCDGADGQGQDGPIALTTGWAAVTGPGNYTLTFTADGDIIWYKGNDIALYFYRDHISFYKPDGALNTAKLFVPALLEAFQTQGLQLGQGISNLSFSYEVTAYGYAVAKFVKQGTDQEVANEIVVGPLKVGAPYEIEYPTVAGFLLVDSEETKAEGTIAAGRNVVKTVEYYKDGVTRTLKAYTGTQEHPGSLIGTKVISGQYGQAYELDAPDYPFYIAPEVEISGTYPSDDSEEIVYGYEFSAQKSIDVINYGDTFNAIPDITRETGVYLAFDINSRDLGSDGKGANGDWQRTFESENYVFYMGCHEGNGVGQAYDGAHGHPDAYGEGWNALVSYGRTARIALAYFPNGDIKGYRDTKLVLFWHHDENGTSNPIADIAYKFIDDVHASGFKFSNLITDGNNKNEGRTIFNLTVGKASDIKENAHVTVSDGANTVFAYDANVFVGDRFLGAQVPYGYKIASEAIDGNNINVLANPVSYVYGANTLEAPVVCDQKWDAAGWTQRLYNVHQGAGDFNIKIDVVNFGVNGYEGNPWKGMLITFVSDMLAVAGQNMWSDKTYCLGNSGNWGTQTYPAMHMLYSNTGNGDWANANALVINLTRQNRLYACGITLLNGENVISNVSFAAIGVDFGFDTIYLSAEFAKFTLNAIQYAHYDIA